MRACALAVVVAMTMVQPQASDAEAEIIALERTRQEAFVRGDVEFLDRQTAEDYTTLNFTGALSTKPEMMRSLRAGTTKVTSYELSELRARVYGAVAILTGIYRDQSSVNGHDRRVNVRFTRVFVKDGAVWRAVSYQQTALASP